MTTCNLRQHSLCCFDQCRRINVDGARSMMQNLRHQAIHACSSKHVVACWSMSRWPKWVLQRIRVQQGTSSWPNGERWCLEVTQARQSPNLPMCNLCVLIELADGSSHPFDSQKAPTAMMGGLSKIGKSSMQQQWQEVANKNIEHWAGFGVAFWRADVFWGASMPLTLPIQWLEAGQIGSFHQTTRTFCWTPHDSTNECPNSDGLSVESVVQWLDHPKVASEGTTELWKEAESCIRKEKNGFCVFPCVTKLKMHGKNVSQWETAQNKLKRFLNRIFNNDGNSCFSQNALQTLAMSQLSKKCWISTAVAKAMWLHNWNLLQDVNKWLRKVHHPRCWHRQELNLSSDRCIC